MIVRLNDDAKADAKSIDTWWRENRPHAPGLFVEGLKSVIALLKTAPNAGEHFENVGRREVRRVLMPKTRHYAYHFVVRDDVIEILAIWGTQRGDGPPLHER